MSVFKKIFKSKYLSDEVYIAEYQDTGNLETLGVLYEKYMDMAFAICFKYLKDEEQSKDAVLDIFEELIDKLKIHKVENFRSWLHSLTRNHCLMKLRSVKNISYELVENHLDLHLYNIEIDVESNLQKLEKCMETLAPEQKTSINLFFYEMKCYKEISENTGFEFSKVKSYIQNGKRNLKNCIENG